MSVIQREEVVAAGATVENVLQGSAFEFLSRNAVISAGVTATATGTFTTIQSGSQVILEESPPMVQATFPRIPDEMAYNFAGVQGDRLVVRFRNPTVAPVTMRTVVQIAEL